MLQTTYQRNDFPHRPSSTDLPANTHLYQQQNYNTQGANNYPQYYPQSGWNAQHAHARGEGIAAQDVLTTADNPYSENSPSMYGPNVQHGQWQQPHLDGLQPVNGWNHPNWSSREWTRRDGAFSIEHTNSFTHDRTFPSMISQDIPQNTGAPGSTINANGTNYQRTLQYVQQCQTNWNGGAGGNAQPN